MSEDAGGDPAHVRAIVDAAPPALRDRVSRLAQGTALQAQVARSEITAPHPAVATRVVGGDKVPPGAFLHCACLGGAKWKCSGALIAPRLVLSAGHCKGAAARVMVGGTSVVPEMSAGARVVNVARAIVHPGYLAYPVSDYDLMLLILEAEAYNPAVALATADEIFDAESFDVVGFGYDDPAHAQGFGIKRRATIPLPAIIRRPGDDLGTLPEIYGFHPDYEFVAGRKNLGVDSCNGDSGGPIYVMVDGAFKLAGLTSRATRVVQAQCGDGGIYLQPRVFIDWINEQAAAAGLPPVG